MAFDDAAYISYVESGESAAVFIVRDIVKSINTAGKWIDVIETSGGLNDDKWDFSSITVELFPRKIKPIYPPNCNKDEIKYITWKTAAEDIEKQRARGYKGSRFEVRPKLVNKNKNKTITVELIWNKKFKRYIPKNWARTADCETVKVKVPRSIIYCRSKDCNYRPLYQRGVVLLVK